MAKRIKFDPEKCCGCKTCQLVCSYKNEKVYNPNFSRIKIVTQYKDLDFKANVCMQCKKAPCMNVCPNNAIYKDDDGTVKINYELCTSCKLCVSSCPFGNIAVVEEKVVKCELCGGDPECVKSCPTFALTFVEV